MGREKASSYFLKVSVFSLSQQITAFFCLSVQTPCLGLEQDSQLGYVGNHQGLDPLVIGNVNLAGNTFCRGKRKKKKKKESKRERAVQSFPVPGAEHVSVSVPRVGKSVNQRDRCFLREY